MADVAVEVRVSGQVQGVGFRMTCVQEAQRLGVRGWVRNEPDESVMGHFEGDPDAVTALVEWCRTGPTYAAVTGVRTTTVRYQGLQGFRLAY